MSFSLWDYLLFFVGVNDEMDPTKNLLLRFFFILRARDSSKDTSRDWIVHDPRDKKTYSIRP
jgi:hypothetical protein